MRPSLLYHTQTRWLFHAHVKLKFSLFLPESLFDELFATMEEIDTRYNSYSEGSFIDRINRQAGNFVDTDETTIGLLNRLYELAGELEDQYDITVMPLIRLWGFYKNEEWRVPTENEIKTVLTRVGYRSVQTDGIRVRIEPGQEIITGSFLKAFAVDKVAELMRSTGIDDAIINAGGSSICAINNEAHPCWEIEIDDTEDETQSLFCLGLANRCYSTSAANNTYLQINGKRYGHILSPRSGYPSENRQVGIISHDAMTGDVLSTGLFNFDKSAFLPKMEELSRKYDVEGFMTDKNGDTVFSAGFKKYIVSY
jgi:thiamine biosynthesis lipoprotein